MKHLCRYCIATLFAVWLSNAHALDATALQNLATGDNDARITAIEALAAAGDVAALPVLRALQDGALQATPAGRLLIVTETGVTDAVTNQPLASAPADAARITINNRVRRALDAALAAFKLFSPDSAQRLEAAQQLGEGDPVLLPLVQKALTDEKDSAVRAALELAQSGMALQSDDPQQRLAAVQTLGNSAQEATKTRLLVLLEKDGAGQFAEPDAKVRVAAKKAIAAIEQRLKTAEYAGHVFTGISLGSILLLAALGLAIVYGLMGVINMAHGELLMIGAYATYVVQNLFKIHLPQYLDFYLVAAVPVAFGVAALVGMALERGVIRHLYGRPLETLLATWGISLILIQFMRTVFGAQNVEVANPSWMTGGVTVLGSLVLPYNRIVIIVFAMLVLCLVWLALTRTRLGLHVRAVTQNRSMADCMGVPAGRTDMLAFGLGAGVAGLGGCALSQIGNVGPELGQGYIVDSFMVVVLGGVGQIAGTVYAALGLGVLNKFLEPYWGAVLAKIMLLVFIILFIQKRPQGLFAVKGRTVEG